MSDIGIVGWGFVGQATGNGFATNPKNKILWFDKYKDSPNTFDEVIEKSDFIFVCLPTPMYRDYSGMDLSIVKSVTGDIAGKVKGTDKIVIIKSTVMPGTTKEFIKKYPKVNFAMNPEFLTQRKALEDFLNPSRTVIGAKDEVTAKKIKKLYQSILPANQQYFLTDTTSAELTKVMSNLILATKIMVANEFYFLSKFLKIDYDNVRKMVEADTRIGTFLKVPGWDGELGFGHSCFPKDMIGLLQFGKENKIDLPVLDAVWKENLKVRKNRDWEVRENAFGRDESMGKNKNSI